MFKVGLTRDFLNPEGNLTYKDIGLHILDNAGIEYDFLKKHSSPVTPDLLKGYDAVISLSPAYTADSFKNGCDLKAICRFGVGYDMIDLKACDEAGVMVTITSGAVNYSVAEAIVTWMLALSHRAFQKDTLVRTRGWAERVNYMGTELRGRTLGVIGLGGIGSTLVELIKPFRMNPPLAFDPFADTAKAESLGVKLVDMTTLLQSSDFVSINCPLNDNTRNLIGEREFSLLKKSAYIVNTARGGILNQDALIKSLGSGSIAGYATDVFDQEPPLDTEPLLRFDNVILAPHCIAWTDDLFKEIGTMACKQVVQVAEGKIPDYLINASVFK